MNIVAQSIQDRKEKIAQNIANQFEKSVENKISEQKESVEIYTREGLEQYQTDLTKAFQDNLIDASEFNKGMRNIANLEKKTITDKNGHQKTVYTRHSDNGEKHDFHEGHKVVFEDKGVKKVGTISKLKHHEVYDKFGTAHITDEKGNKYSKSLRGIEHHEEGKELEQTPKAQTSSEVSEDDRGLPRLNTKNEMKPEEVKAEVNKHKENHTAVKEGTKDRFGADIKRGHKVLIEHDKSVSGYKHDMVHVVGHDKETGDLMGVHPSTKELHKINPDKAIVQKDYDASGHDDTPEEEHGVGSEVWVHDGGKHRKGKVTASKGNMRKIKLDGLNTPTTTHVKNLSKEKPEEKAEPVASTKAKDPQVKSMNTSVGRTTSGMDVKSHTYGDDEKYEGFTADDHKEAAQYHASAQQKATDNNYPKKAQRHSDIADSHYAMAEKLGKTSFKQKTDKDMKSSGVKRK